MSEVVIKGREHVEPEIELSDSYIQKHGKKPFSRITIELETINPDGSHEKPRRIAVNSWLKQMAQMFYASLAIQDYGTVKGLDGGSYSLNGNTTNSADDDRFEAMVNTVDTFDGRGIQVGSGSQAVDKDDWQLQTKIASSTTGESGKLRYQAMVASSLTAITNGYRVTLSRQFDNESGATITINEVGLILRYNVTTGTGVVEEFLVLRDIIPSGHAVVDGGSVIVRYHIDFVI